MHRVQLKELSKVKKKIELALKLIVKEEEKQKYTWKKKLGDFLILS